MHERKRFTLDGSDALEAHLSGVCDQVLAAVCALVPNHRLEGLLLGGGYGRGEGGVWRTDFGDFPYNDIEFYILIHGNCRLNERRYGRALRKIAESLSQEAEVHVEFKIISVRKLEQSPVTMFFYDLVSRHRCLFGPATLLDNCSHHLDAVSIPLHEATRLLMNRCSGLLFASELLQREHFTAKNADFVGRNHAKARLAFGDALLAAHGLYHWSCRERLRRLQQFTSAEPLPWLDEVRQQHCAGVEFKLHPQRVTGTAKDFAGQQCKLTVLGLQLWLWLESRRLGQTFSTAREYATSYVNKCPDTAATRNLLINARTFGLLSPLRGCATHYPREKLFHALALLLWEPELLEDPQLLWRVREELQTDACRFPELVWAYEALWQNFS